MGTTHKTGTTTETGAAHGGGHGNVFPPMDPATFASQIVWLALTFGALYLLMSKISLPRIGQVVDERRERIQRDLDEAERMKNETETALADYERALNEARSKASAIATEEREQVKADTERARKQADAQDAKTMADAEARIAASKTAALSSVGEIAEQTAASVVEKLIGSKVGKDEIQKALNSIAK